MSLSIDMVIRWLWFVGQWLDSLYSMCPLNMSFVEVVGP